MMFYCSKCGAYLEESDLVSVTYERGRKCDLACPECFAESINAVEEVPEDEEREIRREWEADALYDRMMEEE